MARDETPLDQAVFDATLEAELAKGTDRRVAEGRARSSAVRAYRKAHPDEVEERPASAAAAPAGAPPAAAAATQTPAAAGGAPVAIAGPTTTSQREAPLPTGNLPTPKKGQPDKHRLLALVPPEGIQRVEREQGDRVNTWPHLLIEEFIASLIAVRRPADLLDLHQRAAP